MIAVRRPQPLASSHCRVPKLPTLPLSQDVAVCGHAEEALSERRHLHYNPRGWMIHYRHSVSSSNDSKCSGTLA